MMNISLNIFLIIQQINNYILPQNSPSQMPKQIKDLKEFLSKLKGGKGDKTNKAKKRVFIKKNKGETKFKVRKGRTLFTFKTSQADQTKRVQSSLDAKDIEKVEIKKRLFAKKAKK